MDAKSRTDFINAVASEETVSCPVCGEENAPDSKICVLCGAEFTASEAVPNDAPAFETVKEEETPSATEYVEPDNVFAQGLPAWSLEPPQEMVRRSGI